MAWWKDVVDTVGGIGKTYVEITGARANLEAARAARSAAPQAAINTGEAGAPQIIALPTPDTGSAPVIFSPPNTTPAHQWRGFMDSSTLIVVAAIGGILLLMKQGGK